MTSRVKSLRYGNLMNLDKTWHTYWVSEFYTNIFYVFYGCLRNTLVSRPLSYIRQKACRFSKKLKPFSTIFTMKTLDNLIITNVPNEVSTFCKRFPSIFTQRFQIKNKAKRKFRFIWTSKLQSRIPNRGKCILLSSYVDLTALALPCST